MSDEPLNHEEQTIQDDPLSNGEKPIERDSKGKFAPGTAPGPGRPKGSFSLIEMLRKELEKVDETDIDKRTYAQILIAKIVEQSIKPGDTKSTTQKLIMNYLEGLPKATLNIGGDKESLADLTEFFRLVAQPKQ